MLWKRLTETIKLWLTMAVEFIKARQMQTYLHLFKHTHTQTYTLFTSSEAMYWCVCCQIQTVADINNTGPMQQDYGYAVSEWGLGNLHTIACLWQTLIIYQPTKPAKKEVTDITRESLNDRHSSNSYSIVESFALQRNTSYGNDGIVIQFWHCLCMWGFESHSMPWERFALQG